MRVSELRAAARAGWQWVHAHEWYLRYRLVVLVLLYLPVGWKHRGFEEFVSYLAIGLVVSFVAEYEFEVPELRHTQLVFRRGRLGFTIGGLLALTLLCEWAVLTRQAIWWWLGLDITAGLLLGSLCSIKLLRAHHELDLEDARRHLHPSRL